MQNHQLAMQEIEKFVRVFKAFDEAKNALASLASLDQNVSELEKQKKILIKQLEDEKTLLEKFKAQSDNEKKRIISIHEKRLSTLEETYLTQQEALEKEFKETKQKQQESLRKLKSKVEKEQENLVTLQKKCDDKENQQNSLEIKLSQTREKFRSLLNE